MSSGNDGYSFPESKAGAMTFTYHRGDAARAMVSSVCGHACLSTGRREDV